MTWTVYGELDTVNKNAVALVGVVSGCAWASTSLILVYSLQ